MAAYITVAGATAAAGGAAMLTLGRILSLLLAAALALAALAATG